MTETAVNSIVETNSIKQIAPHFFQMAHKLVFSQLSLSTREHDVFALFLSRLHKDHWLDFQKNNKLPSPSYQFNSETLSEWFGVDGRDLFNTINNACDRLAQKTIGIADGNKGKFRYRGLFKDLSYENGVLNIVPNDILMAEYLGISQGHAKMDHRVFRDLKSEHSKRLYTMLSRFKQGNTTLHPQSINELHGFFGLLDKDGSLIKTSFATNKVFIDRCIRKSINEIQKCDPKIIFKEYSEGKTNELGFKPIRTGRKITSIKFLFSWLSDSKDEKRELDRLSGPEQTPLELIYELVNGFVPLQAANPTEKELTSLMNGFGELIAKGKLVDQSFMDKFNMAKAEAELS